MGLAALGLAPLACADLTAQMSVAPVSGISSAQDASDEAQRQAMMQAQLATEQAIMANEMAMQQMMLANTAAMMATP